MSKKIKLSNLIPDQRNNNKHTPFGMDLLAKSVEQNGILESITVSNDDVIISGNARQEVIGNKFTTEPIIIETDGSRPVILKRTDIQSNTKEFYRASIMANTTSKKNIDIDTDIVEVLAEEYDLDIQEMGVDMPIEIPEAVEDDYVIPDKIKTDIVLGDLFEIGQHRLLCGDSTDSDSVARLMNGQKADMVFTDPPYGMKLDADWSDAKSSLKFATEKNALGGKKHRNVIGDHDDFTPELINTIFACFNDCKEIFIWGADYFSDLIPNKNDGSWIVWDKRANGQDDDIADESSDKMYGSCFELCWSKQRHKRDIARIKWAGIFGTEKEFDHKRHHPTQKPSLLAQWFFNKWGSKGDLIADLFLGSGSTMVASHQLNRKCYGMELDPQYCQVIIDRMLKLDPNLKVTKNGEPYQYEAQ